MDENKLVEIKVTKGGPYVITGNFKLISPTGEELESTGKAFFCRCGKSLKKPFCDGTHKTIEFDK